MARRPVSRAAGILAVALAAAALLGQTLIPQADGAPAAKVRGPFLLTSLPSVGQVVWFCGPRETFGLGIRAFPSSATHFVAFRAGGRRTRVARVDPGGPLVRAPLTRDRRQGMLVTQRIEPGTLRAVVRVDFKLPSVTNHRYPYDPPRTDVIIWPRG